MAQDWQVFAAKQLISWPYDDLTPIRVALTAGDTHSDNREGNRAMAQYGDSLIPFIIMTIGFELGISRKQQNMAVTSIKCKTECAKRARLCGLDALVKPSIRQCHITPQPTVLKNAMYALVVAAWMQSKDWSYTLATMADLRLICRSNLCVDPQDLQSIDRNADPFRAFMLYNVVEEVYLQEACTGDSISTQTSCDTALTDAENQASMECSMTASPTACSTSILSLLNVEDAPHGIELSGTPSVNAPAVDPSQSVTRSSNRFRAQTKDTARGRANENLPSRADSRHHSPSNTTGKTVSVDSPVFRTLDEDENSFRNIASPDAPLIGHIDDDFNTYRDAIHALRTPHSDALIQMVSYIGSSAAMVSLKYMIKDIRNIQSSNGSIASAMSIGKPRCPAERLSAIRALDKFPAHFELARRMHIYQYFEENREDTVATNDPFVLEMGLSGQTSQPRGNPLHRQAAAQTRDILKNFSSTKLEQTGMTYSKAKKMRRVGGRLRTLVERFGLGVLALLDDKLTNDVNLKITDHDFIALIPEIDRFEGDRIRALSNAALGIVDMLLEDGEYNSTFPIERAQEDSILREPRCSPAFVLLLCPEVKC